MMDFLKSPAPTKLELVVDGTPFSNWTFAEVTAGIARVPRTFQVGIVSTDCDQLENKLNCIAAGQPCVLRYDGATLLTGYIDGKSDELAMGEHCITLHGRGACADIIDCSFEFWGSEKVDGVSTSKRTQLNNIPIYMAVEKIIAATGVKLKVTDPHALFTFNNGYLTAMAGDTSYSAIEVINQVVGTLLYEDGDGSFVMGQAGHPTGPDQKKHKQVIGHETCITSSVMLNLAGVYSDYNVYSPPEAISPDLFHNVPSGYVRDHVFDNRKNVFTGQSRIRNYTTVVTGPLNKQLYDPDASYQSVYARWFANRSKGMAEQIQVEVQGWKDADRVLWAPNQLVTVNLPKQDISSKQYLIVDCSYHVSPETGTVTRMLLMPKEAWSVAPLIIPNTPVDLNNSGSSNKIPKQTLLDAPPFGDDTDAVNTITKVKPGQ